MVIFGGLLQDKMTCNDLFMYNVTYKVFTQITKDDSSTYYYNKYLVPCLFGSKMKKINNKVIIFGGSNSFIHMMSI